MLHSLLNSSRAKLKLTLLAGCVATIATTAFAIGGQGWFTSVPQLKTSEVALPQTRLPSGPVQLVQFTIYDVGIYPQETRVRPGRVAISIEDLTGSNSGLVIERVVADGRVPAGVLIPAANRFRVRAEFPLLPGSYEVSVASRPDNRAKLIVEP